MIPSTGWLTVPIEDPDFLSGPLPQPHEALYLDGSKLPIANDNGGTLVVRSLGGAEADIEFGPDAVCFSDSLRVTLRQTEVFMALLVDRIEMAPQVGLWEECAEPPGEGSWEPCDPSPGGGWQSC